MPLFNVSNQTPNCDFLVKVTYGATGTCTRVGEEKRVIKAASDYDFIIPVGNEVYQVTARDSNNPSAAVAMVTCCVGGPTSDTIPNGNCTNGTLDFNCNSPRAAEIN